jgi:hypothetical protein
MAQVLRLLEYGKPMSPQVVELFEKGTLIRPSPQERSLVHLVRAIAGLCGVENLNHAPATTKLMDDIGPADHLVFVLLDGLGMNLVQRLSPGSFFRTHIRRQILGGFPSTTASALTSVATADWPSRHGVTGWFTHLPEFGITCIMLPFIDRFTHQPLIQRGIRIEQVLPLPAFYPHLRHRPLTLMPAKISHTVYATYSRGGTEGWGYSSIAEAIDRIIGHVREASGPTYTHLYIHDIDSLCHKVGVFDPSVDLLVSRLDAEVARLAGGLRGRATIIASADHGLINVELPNRHGIHDGDPLLELLQVPPSGDARLPLFHVKPGRHEEFEEAFDERFGDQFLLLNMRDADALQIFGPAPMVPKARAHFGNYVGIAFQAAMIDYMTRGRTPATAHHAQHAGLSPQEMLVPMIVAS